MDRFALSTAGLATVSLGGIAAAGVNISHSADRWAGEHAWQMVSSGGALLASATGLSYTHHTGSFSYFSYTTNSAATSHWGTVYLGMDLGAGTYTVSMQDSYGDGWAWESHVGGLTVSGDASGGASFPSGSAVSFEFTVVPAPGAMALLGLAGLASRRRRRA